MMVLKPSQLTYSWRTTHRPIYCRPLACRISCPFPRCLWLAVGGGVFFSGSRPQRLVISRTVKLQECASMLSRYGKKGSRVSALMVLQSPATDSQASISAEAKLGLRLEEDCLVGT